MTVYIHCYLQRRWLKTTILILLMHNTKVGNSNNFNLKELSCCFTYFSFFSRWKLRRADILHQMSTCRASEFSDFKNSAVFFQTAGCWIEIQSTIEAEVDWQWVFVCKISLPKMLQTGNYSLVLLIQLTLLAFDLFVNSFSELLREVSVIQLVLFM